LGKKILIGVVVLVAVLGAATQLLWRVDEKDFAAWSGDADATLAKAQAAGKPTLLKLGAHY
jgi:hypothetical protein